MGRTGCQKEVPHYCFLLALILVHHRPTSISTLHLSNIGSTWVQLRPMGVQHGAISAQVGTVWGNFGPSCEFEAAGSKLCHVGQAQTFVKLSLTCPTGKIGYGLGQLVPTHNSGQHAPPCWKNMLFNTIIIVRHVQDLA